MLLLSPLVIGTVAGGRWTPALGFVFLGCLAMFLLRQPLSLLVKVYSGRRSQRDWAPAVLWSSIYITLAGLALLGILQQGMGWLLWLAVPAAPVFGWHLWLISRRAERRRIGVEVVASGVLALSAPATFWAARGRPEVLGWVLWLLIWLQSAASIVYAYLRLTQRAWPAVPGRWQRLRAGRRALLYAAFNLVLVAVLARSALVPPLLWLAYAIQAGETLWGTLFPAVKASPRQVGLRQLFVSLLFTLTFLGAWHGWPGR